jgi:hypothetical protein
MWRRSQVDDVSVWVNVGPAVDDISRGLGLVNCRAHVVRVRHCDGVMTVLLKA